MFSKPLVPISIVVAVAASTATAAPTAAAQDLAYADSLIAAADTAGAMAVYEALIAVDDRNVEAHYNAGLVHLYRYLQDSSRDDERRDAEDHFRSATTAEPDSAHYWLALADVLRTKTDIFSRTQSRSLVERARELARTHGSSHLPEIEYRAARIDWGRYEERSHRYQFVGNVVTVDLGLYLSEWEYVENFFRSQVRLDPADPGASDRLAAEDHLRASLSADPRRVDAAGLLIVSLGEVDRWAEAFEVARQTVRAVPDSGRAWALLGLTMARQSRWREAQAAFDTALQRMTPAERLPYDNLGLLLKTVDQIRFEEMTPEQQTQLRQLYWAVSQPLFLEDLNQPRIEFFARLTFVDHRWSDPYRAYRGYEADLGKVYLRYGPPDIWANLSRGQVTETDDIGPFADIAAERNAVLWAYEDSELRFAFSITPGFERASLAGDFPSLYRQAVNTFPVRFDNVPAVRQLDTILVQFAQFRGDGTGTTQLAIFSFMPIGRMALTSSAVDLQLVSTAILKDLLMRDVIREDRDDTIRGGDSLQIERRSWRFEISPGNYLLRVEALLPALRQAARSSSVLNLRTYDTDSLMLSDVIVAERVAPRDSAYSRWTDFFIDPSAGLFEPNSPVALMWEVYNLVPDSAGIARYTVQLRITVEDVDRRGFAARILGGIADAVGLSARGDDQVALSYDREVAVAPGGNQVEYITLDLEDAPEATYSIAISVIDLFTGSSTSQLRRIHVTSSESGS